MRTLHVYRNTGETYTRALTAGPQDQVRAEPFADIEIFVGSLFGLEPEVTEPG